MSDIERTLRNAGRRYARAGNVDKAEAYRYAAWLLRAAMRGTP